ncbi:DUF6056 family protein [Lelliottia amnigena]
MKLFGYEKLACFFVIFLIVLMPSMYVPMQSDDYSFMMKGISPLTHYYFYLQWSGRLVANFTGAFMMGELPHYAYVALNSMAFSLLVIFISSIPFAEKLSSKWQFYLRAAFIFVLYWIANPNLGQTSFWIVGSANYMWTNMFIAAFFVYLLRSVKLKKTNVIALFILGLMAGCSNENTGAVVVFLSVFVLIYEKANRSAIISSMSGVTIGAAILLLSPGNRARAATFVEWNSMSFMQKYQIQFFDRFPQAMAEYWPVYLVLIAAIIVASVGGTLKKSTIIYVTAFIVAAIAANAAFIGSPVFPPRSMNGGLCFMLIALAFVLVDAFEAVGKFEAGLMTCIAIFCAAYFVPSYYLFTRAMIATHGQEEIRDKMVVQARDRGEKEIKIPAFYFPKMVKENDKFDTYHSPDMAKFYGLSKIDRFAPGFDFSQIHKAKKIKTDLTFYGKEKLKCIGFYSEALGAKGVVFMEFTGPIYPLAKKGDRIYMHIYIRGKSGYIPADVGTFTVSIDGKSYTQREIPSIDVSDVEKIEVGIFNTITNKRKEEYRIY